MGQTKTPGESASSTSLDLRRRWLAGAPVTDRRMTIAGVSTALFEGGQGQPPVVLLHGQGGFGGQFLPVAEQLVTTNHVVVPDLAGLGASAVPQGDIAGNLVMRWLDALIDQTCDAPPMLAGHSLGGSIAARYASSRPGRLGHLALIDAGGLAGRVRPPLSLMLALIRVNIRPTPKNAERLAARILYDHERTFHAMGPDRSALYQRYMLELTRDGSVRRANRALLRELGFPAIPSADLEGIKTPTALVWGRHDTVMPLEGAQHASRRYGWPLHIIDDAGHAPPMEQPAKVAAAVRDAMTRIPPDGVA